MSSEIFLIAGEKSGDLHGAHLIKALSHLNPQLKFTGVAGPKMIKEGMECFMPMENFQVMGFSDVFKALPRLYKQFYVIRDQILKTNPAAVIFIDYPGFNLRLAKALRKKNYKGKLIHYICPSVWAWGKKRIQHMSETLDLLISIFPFEQDVFKKTPLRVDYVGNPLQSYIKEYSYDSEWKKKFPSLTESIVAIFPGSRQAEIERNLKKQLHAASLFQEKYPKTSFAISSQETHSEVIQNLIKQFNLKHTAIVPPKWTYELMRDSKSAIAKSGTVTLELALHKRPSVVVYELSKLNWFIAKFIVRLNLPHYCIVNILKNKRVFPELIEQGFNPENLALQLEKMHQGEQRASCLKDCEDLVEFFSKDQAEKKAALSIKSVL